MDTSPIVIDVETAPLPNAADYFEPVEADSRLVDPVKIAASLAGKTAAQQDKAGLDWNTGRIVALGWWTAEGGVHSRTCPSEADERAFISELWQIARQRTIVTYNGRAFDLPYLIQRSRYLGIAHPTLDLRPYGGGQGNLDLYLELTFGRREGLCMRQTLGAFCRRFGIPHDDTVQGKDIAGLVTAGDWAAIAGHVQADVMATVALARRLGVIAAEGAA